MLFESCCDGGVSLLVWDHGCLDLAFVVVVANVWIISSSKSREIALRRGLAMLDVSRVVIVFVVVDAHVQNPRSNVCLESMFAVTARCRDLSHAEQRSM